MLTLLMVSALLLGGCRSARSRDQLLHVSYDPTRELFEAYNQLFAARWRKETGEAVSIVQSHGGSGKQARAVIEGLRADVVSLALKFDVDQISKSGAIDPHWLHRLPHNSSPFYSTIVFLVRKGNAKSIADWNDLVRDEVSVITPNPKTSGGARWNYLAAWSHAERRAKSGGEEAREFMAKLLANVEVFDSGARGAVTTFVEREIGDVLLTWENDAKLVLASDRGSGFSVIYPSSSVRAEPVVAVVDRTVDRRGTRKLAEAYLSGLYLADAQSLIVRNHFRSTDKNLMAQYTHQFPPIALSGVEEFGGWDQFQKIHFSDGGIFDQLQER